MTQALLFWILMLFWLVGGGYAYREDRAWLGVNLLLFILVGLLGWHDFGPPVR